MVYFPGTKIEAITERVEKLWAGQGGSIFYTENEGTTAIVRKYRQLVRRAKQTQVEQIILSGILTVMGSRGQGYLNYQRMAINMLVQQLCREEEVGFLGMFCWEG